MPVIAALGTLDGVRCRIRDSYNKEGIHSVEIGMDNKKVCEYLCDEKRMFNFNVYSDTNYQLLSYLIMYSVELGGHKKLKFHGYHEWPNLRWHGLISTRHFPQEIVDTINQQSGNTIKLHNWGLSSYKSLSGFIPSPKRI